MKASVHKPQRSHKLLFSLFVFSAALVLLAITSARVFADGVQIVDKAQVLDAAQVMEQASQLPNPVSIYTTKTFTGTTAAFDTFTTTLIGPSDSNLIVINIDVTHRHLAIVGGTQVPLDNDQYATAIQAFKDNFNTNGTDDYTGATIAALQSLNTALTPLPSDTGNNGYPPNGQVDPGQMQTFPAPGPDSGSALPFILFVAIVVGAVFVIKTLASAANKGSQQRRPQPLDARPFEAGAIGTMVGYELGREEMERQQHEQLQHQMFNNPPPPPPPPPSPINNFPGGNIGGGASGNF